VYELKTSLAEAVTTVTCTGYVRSSSISQ